MIVEANYTGDSDVIYTRSLYQHDKDQRLTISGIELPETYQVHFSNSKDRGISVGCIGNVEGVHIPDAFLATGDYVYAFVNVSDATTLTIVIPVIPRPVPIPASSDGENSATLDYEVVPEDENLIFKGLLGSALKPTIEEE